MTTSKFKLIFNIIMYYDNDSYFIYVQIKIYNFKFYVYL